MPANSIFPYSILTSVFIYASKDYKNHTGISEIIRNFIPTNTRFYDKIKANNFQSINEIPLIFTKNWKNLTCRGGPCGVKNTALLNIGAETDADLVEIATEDATRPNGGSVPDGDLAGENHVRCHVSIDGNFGEPLSQRNYLPLTSVVPVHSIRRRSYRFRCLRRKSAFRSQ